MNSSLFLVLMLLLSASADALSWAGQPGPYPAYTYNPGGPGRPHPVTWYYPAYPAYPAYPQYPAYAPHRRTAPRPVQRPAARAPAPSAKH
ncbi:MAG TPA: hypothetical protein VET88_01555, partial [Gammaproteobacteria bacterium]|nr:hypothetical protein [Gammaproteobacteria bacterium]